MPFPLTHHSSRAFDFRRAIRSFTMVELLVVVTILSVLMSLLLPALRGAADSAKSIKCVNNLRQIGVAFRLYSNDSEGYAPVTPLYSNGTWRTDWLWMVQLAPYLGGSSSLGYAYNSTNRPDKVMRVFQCPSSWGKFPKTGWSYDQNSYGPNTYLTTTRNPSSSSTVVWPLPLASAPKQESLVIAAESVIGNGIIPNWNDVFLYNLVHHRLRNYLLADGHVQGLADPMYNAAPRLVICVEPSGACWWGYNTHPGTAVPYPPGLTLSP